MSLFHLIRHGRPEHDHHFLGRTDSPLSAEGNAEAQTVFKGLSVASVCSSPLRRAIQTASILTRGSQVEVFSGLSEIDFGEWDGKPIEQVEQLWPELLRQKRTKWLDITPPGGERWDELSARVSTALCEIIKLPGPIAVVAHMSVNAVIAEVLWGEDAVLFRQPYCGVISREIDADAVMMRLQRSKSPIRRT